MAVDQTTATAMADQASDVASTAAQSGREVGSEAANQASEVMRQTKEQMHTLIDDTKQQIQTQAQQRGEQASQALHSFSDQLISLAEGRPEDAGRLPEYVREAESRVRDVASRLQTRGPEGVVSDLGDFARRRPGAFLLGAAFAGFMVGRVVRAGKSQSDSPQQAQWSSPSYITASPVVTEAGTMPVVADGGVMPLMTDGEALSNGGVV
jgi:hypothetical protein